MIQGSETWRGSVCVESPEPVPGRLFWCCESEEQRGAAERLTVISWENTKWYWVFGALGSAAGRHQEEGPENRKSRFEGLVGKGSFWGAEME